MTAQVHKLNARESRLKGLVLNHLAQLGFGLQADGTVLPPSLDKGTYRVFHAAHREEKLRKNARWLGENQKRLLPWFATGNDVVPEAIQPELELVRQATWQSDLFRLASLYWKIPVSDGYGRRMRFLVWDRHNDKLIGLIALGDAVFNQAARDAFIGWDHHRRKVALVNLMDAYVLGAVPPYNQLLGGKLLASLLSTWEVQRAFSERYSSSVGLISGKKKRAQLVAITTTSALGRSSVYNRVKLGSRLLMEPIGYTSGFGHFHLSGVIFEELRRYLEDVGDDYAGGFSYGAGPNWRIRVIRKALSRLGLDPKLIRHGFTREVFFSRLAENAEAHLRGDVCTPDFSGLSTVAERSRAAIDRWVVPRSERDPGYLDWTIDDLVQAIHGSNEPCGELKRVGLGA